MKDWIVPLAKVGRSLGELRAEVVFVGGCVVPLLIPESVAPIVRPTDDVDCVVEATTTIEYYRIGERLRGLGFHECQDDGAPICRWVIDDIRVDVMPTKESALGFRNQWFDRVLVDAVTIELEPKLSIKIPNAPTFLATKFEAFRDRGKGTENRGAYGDSDIEDIATILGYRRNVEKEVLEAPEPIRSYLSECSRELFKLVNLSDIISGCFEPDSTSQSSVGRVLEILETLRDL